MAYSHNDSEELNSMNQHNESESDGITSSDAAQEDTPSDSGAPANKAQEQAEDTSTDTSAEEMPAFGTKQAPPSVMYSIAYDLQTEAESVQTEARALVMEAKKLLHKAEYMQKKANRMLKQVSWLKAEADSQLLNQDAQQAEEGIRQSAADYKAYCEQRKSEERQYQAELELLKTINGIIAGTDNSQDDTDDSQADSDPQQRQERPHLETDEPAPIMEFHSHSESQQKRAKLKPQRRTTRPLCGDDELTPAAESRNSLEGTPGRAGRLRKSRRMDYREPLNTSEGIMTSTDESKPKSKLQHRAKRTYRRTDNPTPDYEPQQGTENTQKRTEWPFYGEDVYGEDELITGLESCFLRENTPRRAPRSHWGTEEPKPTTESRRRRGSTPRRTDWPYCGEREPNPFDEYQNSLRDTPRRRPHPRWRTDETASAETCLRPSGPIRRAGRTHRRPNADSNGSQEYAAHSKLFIEYLNSGEEARKLIRRRNNDAHFYSNAEDCKAFLEARGLLAINPYQLDPDFIEKEKVIHWGIFGVSDTPSSEDSGHCISIWGASAGADSDSENGTPHGKWYLHPLFFITGKDE
ncbi:hypothetical protein IJT17_10530 [bacterium]|nr:hypothetical protein [bacterium]